MTSRQLKRIFLFVARSLGAFRLSRYLTRNQLRILCYHGFSIGDEHQCMPSMFMRGETFERRMVILSRMGFPVISLDEAVDKLAINQITNAETVITLDDGWASNLTIAYPILKAYGFPATTYVTTEHLAHSTAVFNMVVFYLFLTSTRDSIELVGAHPTIDAAYSVKPDPRPAVASIIRTAERHLSTGERQACLGKIAAALGLDIATVLKGDRFRLLTAEEIGDMARNGVAIELHTHTHRLPSESFEAMRAEITQNRDAIEAITGKRAQHFCYPSGQYSSSHPQWLSAIGIKSATTCDPGLNDATTNCLLLRRYLDQDDISDIEFEAAITGFRHFLSHFIKRVRPTLEVVALFFGHGYKGRDDG
jgi:peptidoglycan/xylan/chitin deacetylase (PgdA/CDA1 family)